MFIPSLTKIPCYFTYTSGKLVDLLEIMEEENPADELLKTALSKVDDILASRYEIVRNQLRDSESPRAEEDDEMLESHVA